MTIRRENLSEKGAAAGKHGQVSLAETFYGPTVDHLLSSKRDVWTLMCPINKRLTGPLVEPRRYIRWILWNWYQWRDKLLSV